MSISAPSVGQFDTSAACHILAVYKCTVYNNMDDVHSLRMLTARLPTRLNMSTVIKSTVATVLHDSASMDLYACFFILRVGDDIWKLECLYFYMAIFRQDILWYSDVYMSVHHSVQGFLTIISFCIHISSWNLLCSLFRMWNSIFPLYNWYHSQCQNLLFFPILKLRIPFYLFAEKYTRQCSILSLNWCTS
jgi:hypothetical protein